MEKIPGVSKLPACQICPSACMASKLSVIFACFNGWQNTLWHVKMTWNKNFSVINLIWTQPRPICLHVVAGCFCATRAEQIGHNRERLYGLQTQNIYFLVLQRKRLLTPLPEPKWSHIMWWKRQVNQESVAGWGGTDAGKEGYAGSKGRSVLSLSSMAGRSPPYLLAQGSQGHSLLLFRSNPTIFPGFVSSSKF